VGLPPLLNLNFLSKQANLQPGQKAILGGGWGVSARTADRGGQRISVRELDGQAQLTPAVDLTKMENVFVVVGANDFLLCLMVLVFVAQIAEFFIPPLNWMSNAHVYITPVLVFYGAMALPLPLMLVLVFWAGFLLDALTAQVIGGRVEISFGSSILLYAVLAGIMHGLRPAFCAWRWEVHCIMSGVCTSALLLANT